MPFSSSNAPYPSNEPLPSGNAFSVLVVEDQGSVRAALVAELRRAGVSDIFEAPEGQAALHLFKTHRPDFVLLDIKLPGQDGYWVAQQMRESEAGDWTPIIFLSGLDNEPDVWRGIEVGGDDYFVKPVKPAKPIMLMASCVPCGACLKEVGCQLREVCKRPRHVAARYGDRECALILRNTSRSGAMRFARGLGQLLKVHAFAHAGAALGDTPTLSGGITNWVPDDSTHTESMIMRADQALYAAKAQGRNRVFSFEMQMDTLEQLRH